MTEDKRIQVDRINQIGCITLNREHVYNALDRGTVREVVEQMEAFDANARISVIVIRGNGAAFAAGADIGELSEATAMSLEMDDPFADWDRIARIHKPV